MKIIRERNERRNGCDYRAEGEDVRVEKYCIVKLYKFGKVTAVDHSTARIDDECIGEGRDNSTMYTYGKSKAYVSDDCVVYAGEFSEIHASGNSVVKVDSPYVVVKLSENAKMEDYTLPTLTGKRSCAKWEI
jgi:hypothetical protein